MGEADWVISGERFMALCGKMSCEKQDNPAVTQSVLLCQRFIILQNSLKNTRLYSYRWQPGVDFNLAIKTNKQLSTRKNLIQGLIGDTKVVARRDDCGL